MKSVKTLKIIGFFVFLFTFTIFFRQVFFQNASAQTPFQNDPTLTTTFYIKGGDANDNFDKEGKAILKPHKQQGYDVISLDKSLSGRTTELPVGSFVFLRFSDGNFKVNTKPSKGVIEAPNGIYNLPKDIIGIYKVVGQGLVTVEVIKVKSFDNTIKNSASTSSNWSGYVRGTGGSYSDITSNWVVPSASDCSLGDTDSSAWLGIDGWNNTNLIQTGTESGCGSGAAYYRAWWEILPAAEQVITSGCSPSSPSCGAVSPGDNMFAEIKKNTSNWTISLKNLTQNWSFSTTQTYSGAQDSVEWILERPQIGTDGNNNPIFATLTNYGTTSFVNNTQNGANPSHSYATDSIDMIDNATTISTPSTPSGNLNGFAIAYGSTQPNAPGTWTTVGNLNPAKTNHTATLLPSGKVLVTGGLSSCAYNQASLYNPSTKTWSSTNSMSASRAYQTANLVTISGGGTRVLVVGGLGLCVAAGRNTAELYNESAGTWSSAASMADTRYYHSATTLNDGTVLVVGGSNNSGISRSSVELYDPVGNSWTTKSSLNIARQQHTATLLSDGRVFVTGGVTSSGSATATTEIYDPSTNIWSYKASMSRVRALHTATLLPDGNVLVVGGSSGTTQLTAEVYNVNSNSWTATPNLSYARAGHTANLITDSDGVTQEVLVTGPGNKVELYDYINNRWKVTTFMNTGRAYHTATILTDGSVLLVNGTNSSGYTNSTEYYTPQ